MLGNIITFRTINTAILNIEIELSMMNSKDTDWVLFVKKDESIIKSTGFSITRVQDHFSKQI
jgi:hypothetical protein